MNTTPNHHKKVIFGYPSLADHTMPLFEVEKPPNRNVLSRDNSLMPPPLFPASRARHHADYSSFGPRRSPPLSIVESSSPTSFSKPRPIALHSPPQSPAQEPRHIKKQMPDQIDSIKKREDVRCKSALSAYKSGSIHPRCLS